MSRSRWTGLTAKMVGLVILAAGALAAFMGLVVGPRTAAALAQATVPLVERSTEVMREGARAAAQTEAETLTVLIEHTTRARRATLADLPLELYDGDTARIQAAVEAQDRALGRRLVENVERLATEMEARAGKRIDAEAAALMQRQQALAAGVADDLRTSAFLMLAGASLVLLTVLAIGLHRMVVSPVRDLRRAMAGVGEGRLEVDIQADGEDEVAHLVRAFGTMVSELRGSRAEVEAKRNDLAALNANLETEVTKKTAALQQALDGLRATQRDLVLADRMASVGTLAGGIAHEFNNLAGGIRGCAREMLARETDRERCEPLEVIIRAADRAIDVTDKLLRFARPRQPGSASVDLASLLAEALALVEPQARQQGVRTHTEVEPGLRVRGDSGALHQVIVNLLGNALQAMPSGGDVYLTACRTGGEAVVGVRDTGIGIAAGDLDRIFDPFYSTRTSEAATPGRGAGLGLAVSYGIVQAHGGRLQVESSPGTGSTFRVHLPLDDGGPRAATAPAPETEPQP
ncbi:MAG: ATP-binding protein [Planctomycetota bacterium]